MVEMVDRELVRPCIYPLHLIIRAYQRIGEIMSYISCNFKILFFPLYQIRSKSKSKSESIYESLPFAGLITMFYSKFSLIVNALDLVYFSLQIFRIAESSLNSYKIKDLVYHRMIASFFITLYALFKDGYQPPSTYDYIDIFCKMLDLIKVIIVISIWLYSLHSEIETQTNLKSKDKKRKKYNLYFVYCSIYSIFTLFFVGVFYSSIAKYSTSFLYYTNLGSTFILAIFYLLINKLFEKQEPSKADNNSSPEMIIKVGQKYTLH